MDGWDYFSVIRESNDSIDAVGLMTLLPSGSVPIEVNVTRHESGFTWSVRIARLDPAWLALSDSKRWKSVYLYATGEREARSGRGIDSTMGQCIAQTPNFRMNAPHHRARALCAALGRNRTVRSLV